MPALPSLPQSIKTMLQNGIANNIVPDANITFGKRNQDGGFPAVVYKIQNSEILTVGTNPLRKATVEILCYAETAQAAQELSIYVRAGIDSGTYDGMVFQSFVNDTNNILQEPEIANGEEANPFVSSITVDIFYKES